jgi:hypothetical protein
VISLIHLAPFLKRYEWVGNGCHPLTRAWLMHAFIAKSVYQFPTTGALIEALQSRPALRMGICWRCPQRINLFQGVCGIRRGRVASADSRTDDSDACQAKSGRAFPSAHYSPARPFTIPRLPFL